VEMLRFGMRRTHDEVLVAVTSPEGSSTSLLSIVNLDAPFLVDSIRLVIERLGMTVSFMIHPMIDVARDGSGRLTDVGTPDTPIREAWTQMEISRCTGAPADALIAQVRDAVADVLSVVSDFDALRARAAAVAEDLSETPAEGHTATEADQVSKFLAWLTRQHFVFLGAASYHVVGHDLEVVPGSQLGLLRTTQRIDPAFAGGDGLVSIARTDDEVTIHRQARPVCIAVRRIGSSGSDTGKVIGEERFLGLFSAAAYRASVSTIPLIRERVAWVISRSKADPASHTGRALRTVLETFPRDELFEIGRDELAEVATAIVGLQERSLVRVVELRSPASGWQGWSSSSPGAGYRGQRSGCSP